MKSSVNKPTNRVGKVKLSIIMALVVILPIGALMVAVIRNGGVSVESQVVLTQEQQVERAEQLQAIDSYNRATLGMQAMLATQRVEQEQWLDTLIQQSQLVEQAMQELDRVYSNASYISEEAKYFIEALQAQ
ncbi:MAG: hypothetical protein LBK70_01450, partial [Clostridiales bacterium]|nr:hypothetical protein [Clostridiales bacterium]